MMTTRRSPWGAIQHAKQIANGIEIVSTAGHGGFKLSAARNKQVPEVFRRKGGWYEEDCEYSLVVLSFPEMFSEEQVQTAHKSAKNWFTKDYEKHFGVEVPLNESVSKREEAFYQDTFDKFVVRSAWGDWHEQVPKGMVGTYAKCAKTGEEKYFLVPEDEYKNRDAIGFVINPLVHKEVSEIQ